jgi:pimeloyl-ACP methyl ester carboxylesterase
LCCFLAKELHALLVNAKIDKPYVMVGHSFGSALTQYRAISAATGYYETCLAEDEMFEKNLTAIKAARVSG